jgi:AraC family transcriptional regulator
MSSSQIRLVNSQTGDIFPAAPDGGVLLSSANAGWRGITIEFHQIPPLELPEHYIEGHRLAVNISQPVHYEWKDGSRWRQTTLKPGDFCLQTHGELNFPRWTENFEFLAISLEPEFVSRAFQDTGTSETTAFQEQRGGHDPVIAYFTQRFKAELKSGSYGGVLYGESLALAFSLHLIECYGNCPQKLRKPSGKLSSLQVRQVVEYVHEHLTEELSLINLAEQMNLSAFHFARLFKNLLGLSPHQYVLQNRVARAKKLINVSTKPNLTDVGLQVGFYDQAHFTKAFKRVVGVSPKGFFKQVAS